MKELSGFQKYKELRNKKGEVVIRDEETGEIYQQDEIFELVSQIFTNIHGYEPVIPEEDKKLHEQMKNYIKNMRK